MELENKVDSLSPKASGGRAEAPWINNFSHSEDGKKFLATPDRFFEKCFDKSGDEDDECRKPEVSGLQLPGKVFEKGGVQYCVARVDIKLSADPLEGKVPYNYIAPGVDGKEGYHPLHRNFKGILNFQAYDKENPDNPKAAIDFRWTEKGKLGLALKRALSGEPVDGFGPKGRAESYFPNNFVVDTGYKNHLVRRHRPDDYSLVDPVFTPTRRYFVMKEGDEFRWSVFGRYLRQDKHMWRQAVRAASGGDVRLIRGRSTALGGRANKPANQYIGDNGTDGLHGRDGRSGGNLVLEVRQEVALAMGEEFRKGTFRLHSLGERGQDGMIPGDGDLGKPGNAGVQRVEGMYEGKDKPDLPERPPASEER